MDKYDEDFGTGAYGRQFVPLKKPVTLVLQVSPARKYTGKPVVTTPPEKPKTVETKIYVHKNTVPNPRVQTKPIPDITLAICLHTVRNS